MDFRPKNFISEFATEVAELSLTFSEIAADLEALHQVLEQDDAHIKSMLDALPVPLIIVEAPSAQIFYINQQGRELLADRGVIDSALEDYELYVRAQGEICPVEERPLKRALRGETVYENQLEWHIGDRVLPLEIWARPVYDRAGNIVFAIAVLQDCTKRIQAKQLLAETLARQTELEAAKRIQMGFYPQQTPQLPNFELAAYCQPSQSVGGDLYDYYLNQAGDFVITLADVMGKSISAALLMASFRACLRVVDQALPGETIATVAATMAADLDRSDSYITAIHGQLDLAQRQFTYVNAGHGHGLMLRSDGRIEKLARSAPPISPLFSQLMPMPTQKFPEHSYGFGPQDTLILYSDGLIDCRPELNLTPEKIAAAIQPCSTAAAMVDCLKTLTQPEQDAADDLTLLVLRCLDS
jgi:hypothetical protein